mgnify:CR=1 FL=1
MSDAGFVTERRAPGPARGLRARSVAPISTLAGEIDRIGPWACEGKQSRSVKSAERTLALFELFSLHQRPMVVGEIARALEIPQPSVSMLVRNLTSLGYLEHDRVARTYVPTIRIMLLGSWIHRRFSQQADLERRLQELQRRVGETVIMGIQNGAHSQYVLVQLPENPDLGVQSGLLRPITRTAVGRSLLSLKTDREVEALVRRCNAEVTDERLRVRPAEFIDLIRQVRTQGYARSTGDMTENRSVIAVSIPGLGKLPMAIGVGGFTENIDRKQDEILAALNEFKAASRAH